MTDTIVKQGSRILLPTEFIAIRASLQHRSINSEHVRIIDGLLATGMRTTEFWRFCDHPEWYKPSRKCIDLPKGSMLKVKAKQIERTILLSNWGVGVVENIIKNKPSIKSRQSMREILIRAAIRANLNPQFINPKMFRKTWISWLVASKKDINMVSISSGHSIDTLYKHYLVIGFPDPELVQINYYTSGWSS